MKTLDIAEVPTSLREYIRNLGEEPVALLDDGNPVAVLVPTPNSDLETVTLSLSPTFLAIIESSKLSLATQGGFTTEELRREFKLPAPKRNKKAGQRKRTVKDKKRNSPPGSGEADGSKV
jgi:hypothetical protein